MPVVCTGCLQPNPSFRPGSTGDASETASDEESSTLDTSPLSTSEGTDLTTATTSETSSTFDPSTSGSDDPSTSTTGAAMEHTIFVSSADLGGDFGGIAIADALCTDLATRAGLGGTWLSILSDSTVDARDRIAIGGAIRNTMGELVAENQKDLWDGFIAAPVAYTEAGDQFLASPYTGTNADGTASADHCQDWTAMNGANGLLGDAGYAGSSWVESDVGNCNQSLPFYCISQ
jgi:hypothetical protein